MRIQGLVMGAGNAKKLPLRFQSIETDIDD
jgi:hypothetical protein